MHTFAWSPVGNRPVAGQDITRKRGEAVFFLTGMEEIKQVIKEVVVKKIEKKELAIREQKLFRGRYCRGVERCGTIT